MCLIYVAPTIGPLTYNNSAVPRVIQKLIMTIIFVVSFCSNHGPRRRLITAGHRFWVYVFLGISNQSMDITSILFFGLSFDHKLPYGYELTISIRDEIPPLWID